MELKRKDDVTELLEHPARALECGCNLAEAPDIRVFPGKTTELGGGLRINRALPVRGKRMVGAWCFLDHFGPLDFDRRAMNVAPHPHIGLQTVTWLLEGEVEHKDSLNCHQIIRPGQLNLMTAGVGITHSEETPAEHGTRLHGFQFWIALPDRDRFRDPSFDHFPEVPRTEHEGMDIRIFAGAALGHLSPAPIYSPLMGIDVRIERSGTHCLPLNPAFEHALLVVEGSISAQGQPCVIGNLYDLGLGRDEVRFETGAPARFVVVGGEPFPEKILMWWNFVARTHEELQAARQDWEAGEHFGPVSLYRGERLAAPPLTMRLS